MRVEDPRDDPELLAEAIAELERRCEVDTPSGWTLGEWEAYAARYYGPGSTGCARGGSSVRASIKQPSSNHAVAERSIPVEGMRPAANCRGKRGLKTWDGDDPSSNECGPGELPLERCY